MSFDALYTSAIRRMMERDKHAVRETLARQLEMLASGTDDCISWATDESADLKGFCQVFLNPNATVSKKTQKLVTSHQKKLDEIERKQIKKLKSVLRKSAEKIRKERFPHESGFGEIFDIYSRAISQAMNLIISLEFIRSSLIASSSAVTEVTVQEVVQQEKQEQEEAGGESDEDESSTLPPNPNGSPNEPPDGMYS